MTRRTLAAGLVLGAALAACGHYGPPVRSEPVRSDAASTATAPNAPAQPADDNQRNRDGR
jgi:hypothetical protein